MDKAPDAFRTISEVAEELSVPQHVLRFWETRFAQIKPMKRGGGRRYYRPDDVDLLRGIRHLLYGEGYTIRGVQRILREHGIKFVQSVWQENAPQPERRPGDDEEEKDAEEAGERGRGLLLGLLPSLFGQGDDAQLARVEDDEDEAERREPTFDSELTPSSGIAGDEEVAHVPGLATAAARSEQGRSEVAAAAPQPRPKISPEALQKLRAAVHELSECRRIIDAALEER